MTFSLELRDFSKEVFLKRKSRDQHGGVIYYSKFQICIIVHLNLVYTIYVKKHYEQRINTVFDQLFSFAKHQINLITM